MFAILLSATAIRRWILDRPRQFERLLVRAECTAAIAQRRVYPTDVVQIDRHIPSAVIRAVDLERCNVCIESLLVLRETRVRGSDVILRQPLAGAISHFPPQREPVLKAIECELVIAQVVVRHADIAGNLSERPAVLKRAKNSHRFVKQLQSLAFLAHPKIRHTQVVEGLSLSGAIARSLATTAALACNGRSLPSCR